MWIILLTLIVVDVVLITIGMTLGLGLESSADVHRHYRLGLFVSMYTCFIHCLVLFYLIGTGKDIRDAVEDHPELAARFVPWTRRQKQRAFPAACLAIVFMIVAALMGGEVHSRLIVAATEDGLPLRGVPFWWIHLAAVCLAVLSSAYAFVVELSVVRENRRAIGEINRALAAREATEPSGEPS